MLVKLTKDECYNSFIRFYETVATKAGVLYTEDSYFDCRCIDVSKACFEELIKYQLENNKKDLDREAAICLAALYGPKPSIESDEYVAEIQVGFAR